MTQHFFVYADPNFAAARIKRTRQMAGLLKSTNQKKTFVHYLVFQEPYLPDHDVSEYGVVEKVHNIQHSK